MTAVSLSKSQARLANWQRAQGTVRVVASITLFSIIGSVVICTVVFALVYGGIDEIRANVDAAGLALSVLAPLLIAPLASGQLAKALGLAASVIDELEQARADLERLALRDPLTDLLNRRGFFAALTELPEHKLATLVLATVDVDEFKSVNDTYGHAFGDEVLVRVARALRDAAGPDAIVARIGGDEFAACLGGSRGRVTHVRRSLESIEFDGRSDAAVIVRCSLGSAEHDPGTTIDETLAAADAALYEDKVGKKNRVDDTPPPFNFRRAPR